MVNRLVSIGRTIMSPPAECKKCASRCGSPVPDYEVVRGPLCTMIRRWGFPYSPVHPVFSPARMHVDVEYRFYAGLPWFHKMGTMTATRDVEIDALRDDEWVFSGQSFTSIVWMGPDGKLRFGDVESEFKDNIWAVGFCNEKSNDSFVALFLEHRADGLPELKHSGNPMMFYRWHGHVWSRYPLPGKQVPRRRGASSEKCLRRNSLYNQRWPSTA